MFRTCLICWSCVFFDGEAHDERGAEPRCARSTHQFTNPEPHTSMPMKECFQVTLSLIVNLRYVRRCRAESSVPDRVANDRGLTPDQAPGSSRSGVCHKGIECATSA